MILTKLICYSSNWKSQFKEVDLDESMDDACSPQDRYVYELKDMSHKVMLGALPVVR